MKNCFMLGLALCVTSAVSVGEDLTSGPKVGSGIAPFYVTKCAGATDDGVDEGRNLCYRCKNGSRPQVMVFTRSSDAKVIKLVQAIDAAITKNADSKLTAFVNIMGEDKADASAAAKKMAETSKAKSVPFVVPNEFENGPDNYGISPKAAITIVMANESKVRGSVAVADVKDLKPGAVIKQIQKML